MALLQGNTYLLPIRIEDCEGDIVRDEQVERGEFVVGEITKFYGVDGEVVWSEEQQAFIMPLTEQETFGFKKGAIKYQGRVYLKDGSVSGSVPTSEYVYESIGTTILSDGRVGEYGGKVLTIRLLDRVINTGIIEEVDPTVPQHVKEITEQDIENWNKVNKLGNVYKYKGSVQTYADLPTENNQAGDVWNVIEKYESYPAGTNFAWTPDGTWDALGGTIEVDVGEPIAEAIRDNTTQIIGSQYNYFQGGTTNESRAVYNCTLIGKDAGMYSQGSNATALGAQATASPNSIAVGYRAVTTDNATNSVQLGQGTNNTANSFQIASDNIYKSDTHTATFQNLQIGGVDEYPTLSGADAPTTTTVGKVKQFYVETTTPALYYCSSITGTGTTEDPYVYTWTPAGGKQLYQHNIRLGYKDLYTIVISDNSEPFTYTTLSEWLSNKGFTENYRGYFVYGSSDTFNISGNSYYSKIPIFLIANSEGTNLMLLQYNCTESPKGNVTIDDIPVSYITKAVWSSIASSYLKTTITDTVVAL